MKSMTDSMLYKGGNSCRADKERKQKQFQYTVRLISYLALAVVACALPLIGVMA